MSNTSFLGLYIVLSLLAACASVILALLKICRIITIPWLFVTLPICFFITLAIVASLITFFVLDMRLKRNQKYITKNIYE